jgi:hypothetical protein
VTIRIVRSGGDDGLVLRVEGWLEAPDVPELERVVDASVAAGVALDLSELRAACRSGIQALRIFGERGIMLRHVPPSIALQLDADPPDPKPRSNLG